jgi:hypothetical protein
VWGKRMRKMLRPPFRPPSRVEMRAQAERYRGMPKWKYMLVRGWTNLVGAAVIGLVLALPLFSQQWWFRAVYLLLFWLQAFMFARWERSWDAWQTMDLPTVEQAEAFRDALRHRGAEYHADDPFEQQMTYEAAREVDMWIKGQRDEDDR